MTWLRDSNTHLNKSEHGNSKSDNSALLCSLSVEAKEALNGMNINQWYYTLGECKGVMGELVDAGVVEAGENPISENPRYRRIKRT